MSRRGAVLQDYGGRFEPMTFEGQIVGAQMQQRTNEFNAQKESQKQATKGKEQGDAIDYINKLDVPDIGDTTIDLYNDAQLKAVQDELMGMASKGTGVNEIKMAALPKLQKIGQGYTIAKNEYNKIANGVKELSKDYPTGDMEAARNVAGKNMLETIFEFNDDGTVKGYKDPSLIPPDKNYLGELTTNQNLPKWYKRSGSYEKGIKELPLMPINSEITYKDRYGNKGKKVYTGHGSVFDDIVLNEEGKQTGIKLKSESVPLGRNPDGSLIIEEVMPEEQFKVTIRTPAAKLDFETDFNEYLEKKVGVSPDDLDPRAKDVLQRKFALDTFKRTNIHGSLVSEKDIREEAREKNITNVRVNNAGKGDDAKINDLYGRIGGKIDADIERGFTATRFSSLANDEQGLVKQAVENAGYPLEAGGGNIYLAKDGNEYKIYKAEQGKLLPKNKDNEIASLSFIGTNLPKQANVQAKKEVVKQGEQNRSNPKPAAGKIPAGTILTGKDGKKIKTTRDITQEEATAAGYKQ